MALFFVQKEGHIFGVFFFFSGRSTAGMGAPPFPLIQDNNERDLFLLPIRSYFFFFPSTTR